MPRPPSPVPSRSILLQGLCAVALLGVPAAALPRSGVAFADVVTTRDGLVLEGTATTGPDGTVRLPKIGRRPVDVAAEFGSREAEVHDVAAGDRAEIRLPRAGGANPGR